MSDVSLYIYCTCKEIRNLTNLLHQGWMEQTESELSKNNPEAAKVSIASAEYSVFEDTVKRSTAELHSALGAFQVADEELQQKLHAQFLKRDDSYKMSTVVMTDDA